MDDDGSGFFVLQFRYPHLLEGRQTRQNASTDPNGIFPLWRSDYLDLHGSRSQGRYLPLNPIAYAREHGASSREHRIGVQVLPDIHVGSHYGEVSGLCYAWCFHA